MSEQHGEVDFALAAFLEDGDWQVQEIASPAFDSIEALSHALRQVAGDDGAVGMVAVDEDFFVLVRVTGARPRVLLSDVPAADQWELAQSAIDFLGLQEVWDGDYFDVMRVPRPTWRISCWTKNTSGLCAVQADCQAFARDQHFGARAGDDLLRFTCCRSGRYHVIDDQDFRSTAHVAIDS